MIEDRIEHGLVFKDKDLFPIFIEEFAVSLIHEILDFASY